jgi:putative ABC transport system permease protein
MLRSFERLMSVNTGVRTDHLVVATVNRYLPNSSPSEQVKGYSKEYQRAYRKLATLPGVIEASAGDDIPYLGQPEKRNSAELFTKARPTLALAYRGPAASADVMPGYFRVLAIPLLAGRDFTDADGLDRPPVAIISKYTAQALFPGRSAIGEQIRWGNNDTYNPWSTVVGVVGDTKWNPAEPVPNMEVYWSAFQYPPSETNFLVHTSLPPGDLLAAVSRTVHEVSPSLAIVQNKSMDDIVDNAIWQRRLWSYVLGVFATLALLLTGVGLYGVMSHLVSQSTRELGIRMAIGSTSAGVLRLVLRRGMWLVAFGLAAGLGCVLATHRLVASLLFGISDTDMSTYAMVIAMVAGVTFIACVVPALRAARIDPLVALRDD